MVEDTARARFQIDVEGQLPDGWDLVQVEAGGVTILVVRDGEMTAELAHVLNEDLAKALWPSTARFQILTAAQMPGGLRFAPKRVGGRTVLAVREKEMTTSLAGSLNRHLARCTWAADVEPSHSEAREDEHTAHLSHASRAC